MGFLIVGLLTGFVLLGVIGAWGFFSQEVYPYDDTAGTLGTGLSTTKPESKAGYVDKDTSDTLSELDSEEYTVSKFDN
jgi:hypothetical protein